MKKKNLQSLSNAFSEIENVDLTGKQLDDQLVEYGFNPDELVRKVRERMKEIDASGPRNLQQQQKEDFNPFLLAAGKSKGEKRSRRPKKSD